MICLYVDDAAVLISHKDKASVEKNCYCAEVEGFAVWLCDYRLSLHLGKTETIPFQVLSKEKKIPIIIAVKPNVRYLGCI